MGECFGTKTSTSAIPTKTLILPFGKRSAISTWSRSREVSLSMDDQSSCRKSRISAPAARGGGCAFVPQAASRLPAGSPARNRSAALFVELRLEDRRGKKDCRSRVLACDKDTGFGKHTTHWYRLM